MSHGRCQCKVNPEISHIADMSSGLAVESSDSEGGLSDQETSRNLRSHHKDSGYR